MFSFYSTISTICKPRARSTLCRATFVKHYTFIGPLALHSTWSILCISRSLRKMHFNPSWILPKRVDYNVWSSMVSPQKPKTPARFWAFFNRNFRKCSLVAFITMIWIVERNDDHDDDDDGCQRMRDECVEKRENANNESVNDAKIMDA